jgi:hypothetical protein
MSDDEVADLDQTIADAFVSHIFSLSICMVDS